MSDQKDGTVLPIRPERTYELARFTSSCDDELQFAFEIHEDPNERFLQLRVYTLFGESPDRPLSVLPEDIDMTIRMLKEAKRRFEETMSKWSREDIKRQLREMSK